MHHVYIAVDCVIASLNREERSEMSEKKSISYFIMRMKQLDFIDQNTEKNHC